MDSPETSPSRSRSAIRLRVVAAADLTSREETEPATHPEPLSLEEAYRRFAPYVAAIGVRILGGREELDDLVQDVFVEATRGIAKLSTPEAIKAWLARITVRTSVRRLRRARLFRTVHLQFEDAHDYESLASPEATPEQRALIARVYRALEQLAANDRAAWVVRYVQGETLEQAAELCACSISTYQRRLRRASELLDKRLQYA